MKLWQRILLVPGAILVLGALFLGWVWLASEAELRRFDPPMAFRQPIPTDAASIAKGEHIARTRGCFGCHGDALQGEVFGDDPWYGYGRAVAPNLARYAREHAPGVIEAAVRHGIGANGRALYSMPSFNFARMSDADMAALIAFLRTVPVREAALPAGYLGWQPRWDMARGQDHAIPFFTGKVPLLAKANDPRPEVRLGEYLAMTSCNECHGFSLRGDNPFDAPGKGPPDLAGAAGYDRAAFFRLMRTGKATGNRELRLMSGVARGRFVHWSDPEVDAIYAYLLTLGAQ
ncbi:cytochrome c [Sphingomonas sp. AOB5]|uniref:cytochrome c n=1 Tax=Sphingomonas sp. AOB5 TaxID=3034017 RepID=UPI0023F819D2|nr:cytochrome c [Sphingomonas sp. AOB5]MDF7774897.1 cytochrome c [Sphingomonas sp. AOB5]